MTNIEYSVSNLSVQETRGALRKIRARHTSELLKPDGIGIKVEALLQNEGQAIDFSSGRWAVKAEDINRGAGVYFVTVISEDGDGWGVPIGGVFQTRSTEERTPADGFDDNDLDDVIRIHKEQDELYKRLLALLIAN